MKKFVKNLASLLLAAVCITPQAVCPSIVFAAETANVSANLVSLLGSENYRKLAKAGIISNSPENITPKEASGSNVNIESVSTYKNQFVIVKFDSGFKTSALSDIKLQKYSDNWFSLSPKASNMNVAGSAYTLDNSGKSVFIFKVSDEIDGTKIAHSTEYPINSDLAAKVKKAASAGTLITTADNYITWQLDNGGWDKDVDGQASKPWDGISSKSHSGWSDASGNPCGTIDNNATYTQMYYIAAAYQQTKDSKYKESIEKGLEFIDLLQYPSGGLAQVYPPRKGVAYSSLATFNDNAMINALLMLEDIEEGNYPFGSDLVSAEYRTKTTKMLDDATDFIIKSQIKTNGKLTAWCAQHDPVTYEPKKARDYELPSISGSESVPIIKFLMNRDDQTPEVINAWQSALKYFDESKLEGKKFLLKNAYDDSGNQIYYEKNGKKVEAKMGYFEDDPSSVIWYRFYDIDNNKGFFCGRDGVKKYDISEIKTADGKSVDYERISGYAWTGNWAKSLLEVYSSVGYYPNKITAQVTGTSSKTAGNISLKSGTSADAENEIDTSNISFDDSILTITKTDGTKINISTDTTSDSGHDIKEGAFSAYTDAAELFIPKEVASIAENALSGLENAVIFCSEGSAAAAYLAGKNYEYAYIGDTDGNKKVTATDSALLYKYTKTKDDNLFGKNGKRAAEYIDSELSDNAPDKILEEVRLAK